MKPVKKRIMPITQRFFHFQVDYPVPYNGVTITTTRDSSDENGALLVLRCDNDLLKVE